MILIFTLSSLSFAAEGEKPTKEEFANSYTLIGGLSFSRVLDEERATSSRATVLSKLSPSVDFVWTHGLYQKIRTFVQGSYQNISYYQSSSGGLADTNLQKYRVLLGVSYSLFSVFSFFAGAGVGSQVYAPPQSAGVVKVESQTLPFGRIILRAELSRGKSISFSSAVSYSYLPSLSTSSYQVFSGSQTGFSIRATKKINRTYSFFGDIEYTLSKQNTSFANQSVDEVISRLGISYSGYREVILATETPESNEVKEKPEKDLE